MEKHVNQEFQTLVSAVMEIKVRCSRNGKNRIVPVSFSLGGKIWQIESVLDRWPDPDCTYFKVRDRENSVFILSNDIQSGRWFLVFYKSVNCRLDKDGN